MLPVSSGGHFVSAFSELETGSTGDFGERDIPSVSAMKARKRELVRKGVVWAPEQGVQNHFTAALSETL
jgi:hypothetical protein